MYIKIKACTTKTNVPNEALRNRSVAKTHIVTVANDFIVNFKHITGSTPTVLLLVSCSKCTHE